MYSSDPNAAKASFDDIYVQQDPRDYFTVLGALDYLIPDLARPHIRQIYSAWRTQYRKAGTLLDLGSSYGINSALFRFPLTFEMLRRRYARNEMLMLPSAQIRDFDQRYFDSWPRAEKARIIAADISASAVAYAEEVGIVDAGVAHDFEAAPPSPDIARKLKDVDLIFSTGAVGYISEKTFARLLDCMERPPWVASFCLRMFDYQPVSDTLAKAGLVTEKLSSTAFVQRRFRDECEAQDVVDVLRARGLDPAGLEDEGFLYAELYLSRPAADVEAAPLADVVQVASGRNSTLAPRLVRVKRDGLPSLATLRP